MPATSTTLRGLIQALGLQDEDPRSSTASFTGISRPA